MKIIFFYKLAVYISNKNPPGFIRREMFSTPDFLPITELSLLPPTTRGNNRPPGRSIPARLEDKQPPATAFLQPQWFSPTAKKPPTAKLTSCSNAALGETSPVAQGTPEKVASEGKGYTARFLREYLEEIESNKSQKSQKTDQHKGELRHAG